MKKVIILICSIFLLSGCVNINKAPYEAIISEVATSDMELYNTYRKGYKFYLPFGTYSAKSHNFNETIKTESETIYMYIDLLGYLNKDKNSYEGEPSDKYFTHVEYKDKSGYVEVKLMESGKYLVEIMYNYAKIEVMVDESRIGNAIENGMVILKSIKYNDTFLKSLPEDTLMNYKEETVDIFYKRGNTESSHFLQYAEDDYNNDDSQGTSEKIKDVELWD